MIFLSAQPGMITRPGTRGLLMCINTTEQSSVYFASYNITPHIDHVCIARYLYDMYGQDIVGILYRHCH